MASTVIRSTYALDEDTVRRLDALADGWNVSKSEALRRAIRAADVQEGASARLKALQALQRSMKLTRAKADRWLAEVRRERRASTRRASK
jgi:predicted transcriptional regulator